jgi:transcriptional regulator with XRE-family HTH domain
MDVGKHLREAREAAGLTQTQLAEKADVHRTYVSMLERNEKSPTLDVFFRLCKALKVSPSKMMAHIEGR